jgi:hypothetical protein
MHIVFLQTEYVLKRQVLSLGSKYRLFGLQQEEPLLYIEEKIKWLPPSTTIHVYTDEKKGQEILAWFKNPGSQFDTFKILLPSREKPVGL